MPKNKSNASRIAIETESGQVFIVHQFADGPIRESLEAYIEREVQRRVRQQLDPFLELAAKAVTRAREDLAHALAKLGGAPSTPGRPAAEEIVLRHLMLTTQQGLSDRKARTTLAKQIAEELSKASTDPKKVPDIRSPQRWVKEALPPLPPKNRKAVTT